MKVFNSLLQAFPFRKDELQLLIDLFKVLWLCLSSILVRRIDSNSKHNKVVYLLLMYSTHDLRSQSLHAFPYDIDILLYAGEKVRLHMLQRDFVPDIGL